MDKFDSLFLKYEIISKISDFKTFKSDFIQIVYDLELLKTGQCTFLTQKGTYCTKQKLEGLECCALHQKKVVDLPKSSQKHQCSATLKTGMRCLEETLNEKPETSENYYCFRHLKTWMEYEKSEKSEKSEKPAEEKPAEPEKSEKPEKPKKNKKKTKE